MSDTTIPRVRGVPLLGNALGLARDPIGYMTRTYQEYGPVYEIAIPGRTITILAGQEANQLFNTLGSDTLQLQPIYGKLVEETRSPLYLPTLDEPEYGYYRRMIKPRLSRDTLAGYLPEAFGLVRETARAWRDDERVPVLDVMTRLCVEIVARSSQGTPVGDELDAIVLFTNRLIGSGVAFQPAFLLKLPDYLRARRRFEAFLQRIVDAHRATPGDDFVDLVLRGKTMSGEPLEGHDLLAYVHLPLVNGVAYAPRLCGYLLYELLRSPELLRRVQDEADELFRDPAPTMSSLRGMRWLYGACMETLRMYPVAGALPRYVAKPFEFGGHTIREGQMIFIATGVAHFLPALYPEPHRFDPERYFEPRNEHRQPGAFAPYGLGTRTCLSAGMGEALIMLVMAALLHQTELALPRPDYELRTQIAPIPGPHRRFRVRVVRQRGAPGAVASEPFVARLRHVALPVYYAAGVSALGAAVALHGAHAVAADVLVGGALAVSSTAVLAMEVAGARWFSRGGDGDEGRYLAAQAEALTRGFAWTQRAKYLAQAVSCWLVAGVTTVVACQAAGAALGERSAALGGMARALAASPELLRVGLAFVSLDAWSYLRHRAEHARGERGLLWRAVHRWHHTPTTMNVWTGMVVHPIEPVLVFAVPMLLLGALGYGRWEALLLFTLFLVITTPQHMNSGWTAGPLGALIHGPEAHTQHHSARYDERNANYADCLTVWDRLFGTYRPASRAVFRGPFGPGA